MHPALADMTDCRDADSDDAMRVAILFDDAGDRVDLERVSATGSLIKGRVPVSASLTPDTEYEAVVDAEATTLTLSSTVTIRYGMNTPYTKLTLKR